MATMTDRPPSEAEIRRSRLAAAPPVTIRRWRLAAVLAAVIPAVCGAQSADEIASTVRECRQIEGMSARLACYDRAFPPAGGERAASAAPAGAGERSDAPVTTRARPPAAAPRPSPAREPDPGPDDSAGAALPTVSIVQVRELRPGETIFYAEDGRSFVQTGGASRLRVPEPPFEATVESGAFGATFLRLPGDGSRVRVAVRE